MERHTIIEFISFLLQRVFQPKPIPDTIILQALANTVKDVRFHFPELSENEIIYSIVTNQNELGIFLYRVGSELHEKNIEDLKPQIQFLMKDLCSCEIYFNTTIGEGFYIVHGEGTVIGSRNTIGKGFIIHQNCTIGHKLNRAGKGNIIGNYVKMYCNSSILGALNIGDNVTIGAHTMVNRDIKANATVISSTRIDYL